MEETWSHDFYRETDPAKRQQILKAHAGEEEAWAEEYRKPALDSPIRKIQTTEG